MPEHMTQYEFAELRATAMIELEDWGHMRPETRRKLERVKSGEIVLLDEGWVRPIEDL